MLSELRTIRMKSSVGNKLYIFSITLLMLILCNPLIINAQGLSSSKDSERSQWNISVYLGSTNSGPAEDIEQAMINSEFNDVSTRLGMRKVYPHSETGIGGFGSYPWLVSIQRSFSDKMSAGITVSWTRIGETTGLRDDYYFLEVEYSVLTVASVIELHLFNFLNIGAGPAMYIAESCQIEPQDQITARNQSTMFGYLIDLGLMIPSKRRSYFEIKWQYRGVGDVDVGPYDVTLPDGTMTFSGSRVKFNHSYLGLGLGVRF